MAYTRIHAIKSTVAKAVAYICNPDKTEQQLLVDSFGCSPETARHDFDYALSRTKQSDKNQAYCCSFIQCVLNIFQFFVYLSVRFPIIYK